MKEIIQDITFSINRNKLTSEEYDKLFEVIVDVHVGNIECSTRNAKDTNVEDSNKDKTIANKMNRLMLHYLMNNI